MRADSTRTIQIYPKQSFLHKLLDVFRSKNWSTSSRLHHRRQEITILPLVVCDLLLFLPILLVLPWIRPDSSFRPETLIFGVSEPNRPDEGSNVSNDLFFYLIFFIFNEVVEFYIEWTQLVYELKRSKWRIYTWFLEIFIFQCRRGISKHESRLWT